MSDSTHSTLLRPEVTRVEHEGSLVRLHVGNSCLSMGYEDALQIAAMIHMHGKEAKRNAGDNSRRWHVLGVLEDSEVREQRLQAAKWF